MRPAKTTLLRGVAPALFAAAVVTAAAAEASRLAVTPTRVNLEGAGAAALTLRNRSPEKVLVQAQVLSWTQEEGTDRYEPTRHVLVSPPIIELPADADRVVRIAYTGPQPVTRELSYRLVLSEVVPTTAADPGVAVRFAIEFNLPIFVLPTAARFEPDLDWRLEAAPDGGWRLHASNAGGAHAQVRSIHVTCGEGKNEVVVASLHRARYVLTGSSVSWPFAFDEIPCQPDVEPPDSPVSLTYLPEQVGDPPEPSAPQVIAGRIDEVISVTSEGRPYSLSSVALRVHATTDSGEADGDLVVSPATPATAEGRAAH